MSRSLLILAAGGFFLGLIDAPVVAADDPAQPAAAIRPVWTNTRLIGSPEPPPPLKQTLRFPNLKFKQPLYIERDPANQRLWVICRTAKLWSFPDDATVDQPDNFIDLKAEFQNLTPHPTATTVGSALGMAFHPNYPAVPVCWIMYTLVTKDRKVHLEDGTRVSRFSVTFDDNGIPRCDASSERVLMSWLQGGHNGGTLKFGPDGYLYISAGDGEVPTPPDPRRNGQDVTNVMCSVLRIDASVSDDGPLYSIPEDNPFSKQSLAKIDPATIVELPNEFRLNQVLPEIYAYGFRNPWRMNFGPNGQLWVGDVGWELYEMIYNVTPGANYGWSIMEGPHTVLPDGKRGPTPIMSAALVYSHAEGASVTGGFVYQGTRFPELRGQYIFGDYESRRIWAATITPQPDNAADTLAPPVDLVSPTVRIVSFGEDTDGELLLLHFDEGTIYGLERNDEAKQTTEFPTALTDTGLFSSTPNHQTAAGVLPFDINEPMWNDGATATRYVAVNGDAALNALPKRRRMKNSSLREFIQFPRDSVVARTVTLQDDTNTAVRLETQVLHFNGKHWNPYTYVWNPEQTDATLAPAAGQKLQLADYGAFAERKTWKVHSRSECVRCHNDWVGGLLAFTLPQLNLTPASNSHGAAVQKAPSVTQNQLARYRKNGLLTGAPSPPTAAMVRSTNPDNNLNARARSYLAVNCAHCHVQGAGSAATIDLRYDATNAQCKTIGAVPAQGTFQIPDAKIVAAGAPWKSVLLYRTACSGRGRMPHVGSNMVDVAAVSLLRDWITSLGDAPNRPTPDLTSTSAAIELAAALDNGDIEGAERQAILQQAKSATPQIGSLLARFQPYEYQQQLNRDLDPKTLLAISGDTNAGEQLFADKRIQCINCHRVGQTGGMIGPALDDVGQRLKKADILDSILHPSKKIDAKYAAWTALTTDGKVFGGLMVDRTDTSIVLRTPKNQDITIHTADVDELFRQPTSLMPDRLLNDLTDQQIADLLQYISTLKP